MLILDLLVLNVLSLLSGLSVLLVKAVRLSCLNIDHSVLGHDGSWREALDWRTHIGRSSLIVSGLSSSNWRRLFRHSLACDFLLKRPLGQDLEFKELPLIYFNRLVR